MKNLILLLAIFLTGGLHISLFGQTTIEITGTIKSPQGVIQGARIDFLDPADEFLGNSITGPNGKFKSENKMLIGKTIKIKVSKSGFETLERNYKIDRNGSAGEFMLDPKNIAVSGFIKDSLTDQPLPGVEIFFYDQSKLIQAKSNTNSMGYFDLETNFIYGQVITIRVSKKGYYDKEQNQILTSEGMNKLQEIQLPDLSSRGLRAFIRIKDKKTGKPLAGGTVRYLDTKKSTYKDTSLSSMGEVELKLYQRPGTKLDLEIRKPNFRTIQSKPTLSEEPINNVFNYELERDRRSALSRVLLMGSGVAALAGGAFYLSSKKKYNSYKSFDNTNRESDYKSAQHKLNIAVGAAGIATGALIGFVITKINEKNKEKALDRKKPVISLHRFSPLDNRYASNNPALIGISYSF
jgi:hypothetical protein